LPDHKLVTLQSVDGSGTRTVAFAGFCIGGEGFGSTYRDDAFNGAHRTMVPVLVGLRLVEA
jgi:hypothetical protein